MYRQSLETTDSSLVFSGPKRLPEANKNKIILVVDDDADTVGLVTSIGRKAGYMVFGATSGEECLSMLFRLKPQLILLDVKMTGLDGFETCRRVRRDPNVARVPIAFLTARKTADDVRRGLAVGADDFIVKPFFGTQLIERIEFLTSNTQLLRLRRKRNAPEFGTPDEVREGPARTPPAPTEDRTVEAVSAPAGREAKAAEARPQAKTAEARPQAKDDASPAKAPATLVEGCSLQQIATLPLAPFLVHGDHRKAPGVIPAAVLPLWWAALMAIGEDHLGMIQAELDRLLPLDDAVGLEALSRTLLGVAATLTSRLADLLQDLKSSHPSAVKALAHHDAAAEMKLISEILLISRPLDEAIKTFNQALPSDMNGEPSIAELSPQLVSEAKKCYAKVGDGGIAGRLFVITVLNCLEKPWQIFRLVRALSRNRDASVVSGTELGVIGDRLISDINHIVAAVDTATAKFRTASASMDFAGVLALVGRYTDADEGFLTEIDVRRDSPWGLALLRARAKMCSALEEGRLRGVTEAILLPLQEPRDGEPAISGTVADDRALERVIGNAALAIRFLTYVAQRGERHGFGTPARRLLKTVRENLARQIETTLDELRANPTDDIAPAYLDRAIKLVEIVFEDYRGQILNNRLRAALVDAEK